MASTRIGGGISANPGLVKEAQVILPPPSALNPLPALPAALRLDNQDQLSDLLNLPDGQRQLLVFGTDSLRTLLLRQVLVDPNTRVFKGKKNWDSDQVFPGLPSSVVGTRLFPSTRSFESPTTGAANVQTNDTAEGAEVSLLHDFHTKVDWGDDEPVVQVATYFLRPTNLTQTTQLVSRIRSHPRPRTHHRIVYLPQPTALCQKLLSGLLSSSTPTVTMHRLQMDIFPLETDVLSLEYDDAFREAHVEGTPSTLITTVARSLLKIQDVVGTIPRIQSLGPLGEEVVRKMLALRVEESIASADAPEANGNHGGKGQVAAMMVMDRKVDMVTPLLTPLTYEGLLDDVVGIDNQFLKVNVNLIQPEEETKEVVALAVTGSDSLYAEVRDQHVEKFGSFLQNQAKALRESHANFTNKDKKKDLNEIHQFVKQIPIFTKNLRSLTNHIHLAELVKANSEESSFRERWQMERSIVEGETCYELLEDLVACQYPPYRFLCLLCLQSLCGGGIKSSRYDSLRRDVVQTYGYEYLFVLNNMEKAGLLRRRETIWIDSASPFNNLRKSMILINAEVDTVDPDDISYVSSGFAPLTCRLVQTAVQGWAGKDDSLRELPGRLVDIEQQQPPEDFATALKRRPTGTLGSIASQSSGRKPVLVVVFVGGVTYMEIAALRFLSKRPTFPFHIVCVTTKVISGTKLLRQLS